MGCGFVAIVRSGRRGRGRAAPAAPRAARVGGQTGDAGRVGCHSRFRRRRAGLSAAEPLPSPRGSGRFLDDSSQDGLGAYTSAGDRSVAGPPSRRQDPYMTYFRRGNRSRRGPAAYAADLSARPLVILHLRLHLRRLESRGRPPSPRRAFAHAFVLMGRSPRGRHVGAHSTRRSLRCGGQKIARRAHRLRGFQCSAASRRSSPWVFFTTSADAVNYGATEINGAILRTAPPCSRCWRRRSATFMLIGRLWASRQPPRRGGAAGSHRRALGVAV